MRSFRLPLVAALFLLAAAALPAQHPRKSPHETVSAVFGSYDTGNRISITYGRPYTADPKTGQPRKIWGGLVPWNEPWRLGADEATTMTLLRPFVFGETPVPAGAYTLYLIPSDTGPSMLAISRSVGQWGIPLDSDHDFARIPLKKGLLGAPVDQLTLGFENATSSGATLTIKWETTVFSLPISSPGAALEFPQASPTADLRQRIGLTDFEVVYSRPSSKGRVMLGGNNPYGTVWRTGANSATRFSTSTPVMVEGSKLDTGTYELFTIPGKDSWTLIFQKNQGQWGAYAYDPHNDILRVTATPVAVADPLETFTIEFGDIRNESATLNLAWEHTRVPIRLAVDVVPTVLPQIDAAMAAGGRKPYYAAAVFYLEHNLDLDKALGWINAAIAEQPGQFPLLYQKARILAKKGDKGAALAAAQESEAGAAKDTSPAKDEYIRLDEALIATLK